MKGKIWVRIPWYSLLYSEVVSMFKRLPFDGSRFLCLERRIHLKKTNMKFTCVFDGLQAVEDIFSAFLLEEYEAGRKKWKSRKCDFCIDVDFVIGYNGNRFTSYQAGRCG